MVSWTAADRQADRCPARAPWGIQGRAHPARWLAPPLVTAALVLLVGAGPGLASGRAMSSDGLVWWPRGDASGPWPRPRTALAHIGDGRVLMYGGDCTTSGRSPCALGDTWLYELERGRWRYLDASGAPLGRSGHAMTDIGAGRALLFGGWGPNGVLDEVWLYDLAANAWSRVTIEGPGPAPRHETAIAWSGGGTAVMFGGEVVDYGDDPLSYYSYADGETWLYAIDSASWTLLSPTTSPGPRSRHAMADAGAGQILLFGGVCDTEWLADTWLFDVASLEWRELAPPESPPPGGWPMTAIGDGKVLLLASNGTWLFDLATGTWSVQAVTDRPVATENGLALLGGDRALAGGVSTDTWVFDLGDGTWTQSRDTRPLPRVQGHAMVELGRNEAMLFGGLTRYGMYNDVLRSLGDAWVYDLRSDTWTEVVAAQAPSARQGHSLARLSADQVLLFGGSSNQFPTSDLEDTWIFDRQAASWTEVQLAQGPAARRDAAMADIAEGEVLLFGGRRPYITEFYSDTWRYDSGGRGWAELEPAASPPARWGASMCAVAEGSVVLFGGTGARGDLDDTWLYTMATDSWRQLETASSPPPGSWAMAYSGGDTCLLAAPGASWTFDLSAAAWSEQLDTTGPRADEASIAALGGGQVLVYDGLETWAHVEREPDQRWGDCNGDTILDAGDLSATILEVFDNDGFDVDAVTGGTFAGNAFCDANDDRLVDAGDLSCVLVLDFQRAGMWPGPCQ